MPDFPFLGGTAAGLPSDQELLAIADPNRTGAAAVIDAGTNRDPASGGGHEAQARAALAVMQEAQRDRLGTTPHGLLASDTDLYDPPTVLSWP